MNHFDLELDANELQAVMALPVMARRQTAWRIAGACPYRFHAEYVTPPRLPDEGWDIGPPGRNGSVFHRWTAQYGALCQSKKEATDQGGGRELARRFLPDVPGDLRDDFCWLVERYLEGNPEVHPNDAFEHSVAVAANGLPVTARDHAIAHGTIDRVRLDSGAVLRIRDEKTDRHTPPAGELARHFQVLLYAVMELIARLARGQRVKRIESTLAYVRSGIDRTIILTPAELLQWWRTEFGARVRAIARCVGSGAWPATPTGGYDGCGGCPVIGQCPYRNQLALEPRAEITDGKAGELASMFVYAKAFAAKAESALREHVAANGPIPMPAGKMLGYRKRSVRQIDDLEALVEALVAAGTPKEAIWEKLKLGVGDAFTLKDMGDVALAAGIHEEMEIQIVTVDQETFGVFEAGAKKKKAKATA